MTYFATVTGTGSAPAPSVTGDPPLWDAPEPIDGEHVVPPEPFGSVFERSTLQSPDDTVIAPPAGLDPLTNHDKQPATVADRTPRTEALPLAESPSASPADAGGERPLADVTAHRPVVTDDALPRSSPSPVGPVAAPPADPAAAHQRRTSTTPCVQSDAIPVGSALTPTVERRGDVRVASARVPRHIRRREADVRRWLQSAPEVLDVSTDARTTVHIDRVIVETPPSPPEPSAPPRERPVAKGFADYDSIRRR